MLVHMLSGVLRFIRQSRLGRFPVKGTLLPKRTFPYCIQIMYCVLFIQCDYQIVAMRKEPIGHIS